MSLKDLSDTDLVFRVFNEIGIIDQLATSELARQIAPELNTAEFGVLNHFVRLGDGKTPSWLAKAFQVTKPSMTATIGKLERKGFVSVTPSPTDRREKMITLTPDGRAAHGRALAGVEPMLDQIAEVFGADRLTALLPVLSELRAYLDADRNPRDGL